MLFKRSEVFEIVDALFHMYASEHRNAAKEELADMMMRREELSKEATTKEQENLLKKEGTVAFNYCIKCGHKRIF